MSKMALYSKVDILSDDVIGEVVLLECDGDMFSENDNVDGYVWLAREKLKLLKKDMAKTCLVQDNVESLKESAVKAVNNDEFLQFWCDAARLDKGKVKEWLLGNVIKRKLSHGLR